jgi:hypothetical protein
MVTRQTSGAEQQPQTPRSRAVEAYDNARRRASGGIEDAPLLVLAGGVAAGAILASLIPVSRREREVLGPVAGRIRDRATDAVEAAREAGQSRLDELGLTRDKGTDTLRSIVEGAGDAFKASAEAGLASFRGAQD